MQAEFFAQKKGLHCVTIDGEFGIMDIKREMYFVSNEVGKLIWEHCGSPKGIAEIVEALLLEYDVPREMCNSAVKGYLNEMLGMGLLEKTYGVSE